ncbi:MAG: transporter substrate-binding domain-containing protein [Rhodoferax sp.]|nr:transporter substrate-binding domain-containing protein [Rhodoferax sp.]
MQSTFVAVDEGLTEENRLNGRTLFLCLLTTILLSGGFSVAAQEKTYRVALIAHSPRPYIDQTGKFTGFNVEMAIELCAAMKIRCVQQPLPIDKIVDMAAADQVDFAVVGFIATPERQKRVLFSKAYFQSISVWMAKPRLRLNRAAASRHQGLPAQASHAQAMGWKTIQGATNRDHIHAGVRCCRRRRVADVGRIVASAGSLASALGTEVHGAERPPSRVLCTWSSAQQPELVDRINAAIDQIKRDGRFDRINTRFVPFSLL